MDTRVFRQNHIHVQNASFQEVLMVTFTPMTISLYSLRYQNFSNDPANLQLKGWIVDVPQSLKLEKQD